MGEALGPRPRSRVAGANAPAFVERARYRDHDATCAERHDSVAGANAPAFVERSGTDAANG